MALAEAAAAAAAARVPAEAAAAAAAAAARVATVLAPAVAATPAATPEMAGVFFQIAVPLLGVSSVPVKKRPASGILLPPYPVTPRPLPETLRGARQGNPEVEVAGGSLFPGVGGWGLEPELSPLTHPHPRTVSIATVSPGTAPARETAASGHLPPSLGAARALKTVCSARG